MAQTVPMLYEPIGRLVSDLPFVDEHAGPQCHDIILQAFETTHDQEERVVMIHLHGQAGPVLLDMVVDLVGAGPERYAVLTGREVSSDLASLIPNGRATTSSGKSSVVSWRSDGCVAPDHGLRGLTNTPNPRRRLTVTDSESDGSDIIKLQREWRRRRQRALRRRRAGISSARGTAAAPPAMRANHHEGDDADTAYLSVSAGSDEKLENTLTIPRTPPSV